MPFIKVIGGKYDKLAAAKYTSFVFANCNSMKLGNARCMMCGKSFKVKAYTQVCSEKCRLEYIKPVTVKCMSCGDIYQTMLGQNTGKCASCEAEFAAKAAEAYSRGFNSHTSSSSSTSDNMSIRTYDGVESNRTSYGNNSPVGTCSHCGQHGVELG
jgi:hypothetical protein